ncbi:MAG: Uma2 family endonuclease [Gemmataceae bacterium]|nr:Uma2 family endonuclease [Gemmataceae bacterium]
MVDRESVSIPEWVTDHDSFRRWARSEEFPEKARVCYLRGEKWVDMSKEQVFSHNQVKNEFAYVLTGLAKRLGGTYFPDGVLLSHSEAELTSKPDGVYVSDESFDTRRVLLIEGEEDGFVELEGTPDMVLEVVSTSSVKKDMADLMTLYWRASIAEYWLVDGRGERCDFDIFRRGAKGYQPVRKPGGWLKSGVFDASFHLSKATDKRGNPVFSLETR